MSSSSSKRQKLDEPPALSQPKWAPPAFRLDVQQIQVYSGMVAQDPLFMTMINKIPNSEVTHIKQQMMAKAGETAIPAEIPADVQIRAMLVINRIQNRICNQCWNKSNVAALLWCSDCQMTFYCSVECQKKDWEQHQEWCCQPDGPPDQGPNQTAMLSVKPKT